LLRPPEKPAIPRNDITVIASLILIVFSLLCSVTQAEPPPEVIQSLTQKLESWDVEEIWPEVTDALAKDPKDPKLLELAAEIAFDRGDYGESLRLIEIGD